MPKILWVNILNHPMQQKRLKELQSSSTLNATHIAEQGLGFNFCYF